jgi:tRNA(fMet)-specific endonuclease VapC
MRYLLDTCVISKLRKPQPNSRVVDQVDAIDEEDLYLSVITIGEIIKGMKKLPDSKRKESLRNWLEEELFVRFRDKLVPLDADVLVTWGKLTAKLETEGRRLPAIDSLLAASALHGGFMLVTRNEADFEGTGISLHNPWR